VVRKRWTKNGVRKEGKKKREEMGRRKEGVGEKGGSK
jgi:hypothetical protein